MKIIMLLSILWSTGGTKVQVIEFDTIRQCITAKQAIEVSYSKEYIHYTIATCIVTGKKQKGN